MPIPPPQNAKHVYRGHIIDVWEWEQEVYDGSKVPFECFTRPDTATVIPFVDPKTVLLTRQQQPHKLEPFFDFPGGRIEPHEDMFAGVQRELEEEIGVRAQRWCEWARYPERGLQRLEQGIYLATNLEEGLSIHHGPGEKIEILRVSWDDVVTFCLEGKLRQPRVMLTVLQMAFHDQTRQRLQDWLHTA